ncbi:MAG: hypothetical protein P4N59_15860 [Negativicutes bacterium]|nr:hypothetical protein [Pseudomonas sp. MWU13-2100]MDR3562895.1 hypothetical protein [Negativicutes bacterium]
MSTLNEIAANHARMAKAKEEESTGLSELRLQIACSFEIPASEAQECIPPHLISGTHDHQLGQAASCLL